MTAAAAAAASPDTTSTPAPTNNEGHAPVSVHAGRGNVNRASKKGLMALRGVGEKTASVVLKARQMLRAAEDRPFTDRGDLESFVILNGLGSIPHQAWASLKY